MVVMLCCAVLGRDEKINFWDDVYGFNFSRIKTMAIREPLVDNVDPEQIATQPCTIKTIDILTMKKEDATFKASRRVSCSRVTESHG
jgi:type I protein arginine methyltransferase